MDELYQEGQRSILNENEKETAASERSKGLKIDKKKLILYSEILKPKFDQELG